MLNTTQLGPFVRGVIRVANPSIPPQTALRSAENMMYSGVHDLTIRPGTIPVMQLLDDTGEPVTSVIAEAPFLDGALAIGYSSSEEKCYIYRLNATITGWYDDAGVLTETTQAEPIGILWSDMADPPDVMVSEGLGVAYIANTGAADENGLYWPTKTYSDFGDIASLLVNGSTGAPPAEVAYFSGVIPFAQHLFGWGFGVGTTPGFTSYRPELLRFSGINFGPFQTVDSLTLGDRVRTLRERIITGAVVGDALYLAGGSILTRITGQGRNSWYKAQVDRSYGIVGPKACVVAGDLLYYWSPQGPMRIAEGGSPDPLWDAIPDAVDSVANSANIVAAFDLERNQVLFFYDTGEGVRKFCAFDTRRNVWLGPTSDIGLKVRSSGFIAPLFKSTTQAPIGPTAPPVAVSTTSVGNSTALANWTNGDPTSSTEISYKTQAASDWIVLPLQSAGNTGYTFSGLIAGVAYEWRVRHVKNGQYTTYSGPNSNTRFTTTSVTLLPPSSLNCFQIESPNKTCQASWTPSGESGVSTQIETRKLPSGPWGIVGTASPGASSVTFVSADFGLHEARARHVRTGSTPSVYSNVDSFTVSNSA